MKKTIFILLLLLVMPGISFAEDYRIEDVSMVREDDFIITRGMVRNLSIAPIKGYADVDYLNTNGDVVYNMSAGYANKDREIPPGKARYFDHTLSSDRAPGAVSVKVRFIKN
ncbi:MAG: hypothetical protein ABFR82_07360 [Nitrospirota bacterium]